MSVTSRHSKLIWSTPSLNVVGKTRMALASTKESWNGLGGPYSSAHTKQLGSRSPHRRLPRVRRQGSGKKPIDYTALFLLGSSYQRPERKEQPSLNNSIATAYIA
eukprot:6145476-Pyramimonas_sp.AAC.1